MNDSQNINLSNVLEQAKTALYEGISTPGLGEQAMIIAGCALLALILARIINQAIFPHLRQQWGEDSLWFSLAEKCAGYILPLLTALALEVAVLTLGKKFPSYHLLVISAKLAWAWLLVRLFTSFITKGTLSRTLVLIIYSFLALEIIGWLQPLNHFLDGFGLQLGDFRLSLLSLIKGAILAAFLLMLINFFCKFLDKNLPKSSNLSPRLQLLLLKTIRLILYTLAIIIALDSVGLDFYLISVFSGAFGLGLGFGLQRVVANLFCGFVILLDRSVRPGDVIETDGLFGWIQSLHGRFVCLVTRDGKSHLIPNEHLVSHKVVNWSFGTPDVRIKIPVGIAYDSDMPLAMELMVTAAEKHPRVLKYPKPVTRLIGFGDSAINLELRIWIKDPQNGIINVCSDIQLDIWEVFRAHDISFPFPQRDVHVRTAPEVTVLVQDREHQKVEKPPVSGSTESEGLSSPPRTTAAPPPKQSGPGSTGEES